LGKPRFSSVEGEERRIVIGGWELHAFFEKIGDLKGLVSFDGDVGEWVCRVTIP